MYKEQKNLQKLILSSYIYFWRKRNYKFIVEDHSFFSQYRNIDHKAKWSVEKYDSHLLSWKAPNTSKYFI